MNAPRRNLAAVGRWGAARKAASRSGSTRKTDSLAGIRKSGSQGTAARRDSRGASASTSGSLAEIRKSSSQGTAARQVCEAARRTRQVRSLGFAGQLARLDRTPGSKGSSTRKARPHAGFTKRLDAHIRFARRLRKAGSRSSSTSKADKAQKSAAPKNGALPRKTTGANQIRLES